MKSKKIIQRLTIATIIGFSACAGNAKDTVERIPEVEVLIKQMSIEEKVGQMTQITLDAITKGDDIHSSYEPLELDPELVKKAIVDYKIGSILNTANNRARSREKWKMIIDQLQNAASQTRLKIPVIYGIDAIHGVTYTAGATMFPQQIAQAATFNRDLVYEAARITAYECRASSIPWNFSPVLDLGKDPRWARQWETYGEDTYLCSELGKMATKGYQGNNPADKYNVAACLKHYLGYSTPVSGKDRTPAEISDLTLREYMLPPFQESIKAGALSLMVNSGVINGISIHSSHDIISKLLKEELRFNGLVVTDWLDIENLFNRDKIAASHKEAIKIAINAGIDMSMVPYEGYRYCDLLTELIKEGEIPMARIDDAVRRILNVKYKLGLFDTPAINPDDYPKFGCKEFEYVAYNTAAEAITLLKNDNNILPFKKNTRILVTGPNANSMRTVNGGWTYSWQGEKVEEFAQSYNTILEAIENKFGKKNVSYVAGVEYDMEKEYYQEKNINIKAAVAAANHSDVTVLCLGENTYTEKPGDLNDMRISDHQAELALALAKTGKPVILVLNEGRPRVISSFADKMNAIVQTYLSGNFTGDALADILSGDVNPSGKLPYTYPMFPNSLIPYNHKPCEEALTQDGMYDYGGGFYPQFEFGHGLSYTSFEYSDLNVSKTTFSPSDEITVSVKVRNTGNRDGKESVLLFSSDLYASITPDVKRLRKFDKISLKAGEQEEVKFTLTAKDLSFINAQSKRVAEAGDFELTIANQKIKITLTDTREI